MSHLYWDFLTLLVALSCISVVWLSLCIGVLCLKTGRARMIIAEGKFPTPPRIVLKGNKEHLYKEMFE